MKRALRARIAASGRSVADVFAEVEDRIRAEVADIQAAKSRGERVWPVVGYGDIESGKVPPELIAAAAAR